MPGNLDFLLLLLPLLVIGVGMRLPAERAQASMPREPWWQRVRAFFF